MRPPIATANSSPHDFACVLVGAFLRVLCDAPRASPRLLQSPAVLATFSFDVDSSVMILRFEFFGVVDGHLMAAMTPSKALCHFTLAATFAGM